jgi:GMP synthase (glutamine-hydrolysing)
MLLIIDNKSSYINRLIKEYLLEKKIKFVVFEHDKPIDIPKHINIKGVILSGGKGNPYKPLNLSSNFTALMNYEVPFLGINLGQQIIAAAFNSKIAELKEKQNQNLKIDILKTEDTIFENMTTENLNLNKKHNYYISDLGEKLECIGTSESVPFEVIKHKSKPIYGFQANLDNSGEQGLKIIENFLKICNIID